MNYIDDNIQFREREIRTKKGFKTIRPYMHSLVMDIIYCHCKNPCIKVKKSVWGNHLETKRYYTCLENGKAIDWFTCEKINGQWKLSKDQAAL